MRTIAWDISPEEFRRVLRTLRFRYFKWDAFTCGALRLLPESIVLSAEEHRTVVETAERLAAALRRLERTVRSRPELLARLGIPSAVAELIQAEGESDLQLARYDFFPTVDGGWAVSEFNEDVPGGFNEAVAAAEVLGPFHDGFHLGNEFAAAFRRALPADGTVALMYATGYSEDLQHMLVLESLLRDRVQKTVFCAPAHLEMRRSRPIVGGEPISAVVRFYPGEWFRYLSNCRTWRRVLPELPVMNPFGRLISQSKRVFALWNEPALVPDGDRALFASVTPHTEYFGERHVKPLRAEPAAWVLKESFGRMGDSVTMGSLVPAREWEEAIGHARKQPDRFVVQRCFRAARLDFAAGLLFPAIGVYLINGRFAGYYSRVATLPFLTHQASYVPTVVEAA